MVKSINTEYGMGSVHTSLEDYASIEPISTGSIALDCAIGIGGIPKGRVTEISGNTACGKTTLCTHIMKNAQNTGLAVYLDLEHAFDQKYAGRCGLDMETEGKWAMSQPGSGEEAFGIAEMWLKQSFVPVSIIVFDSVDKMQPKKELEGTIEDQHMMGRARLMSTGLHRIVPIASEKNVAIVFTNQFRTAMGMGFSYSKTVGGESLPYYSSLRIELKNNGIISDSRGVHGTMHHAKIKKNKVGAPYGEIDFEIFFEEGISRESGLIDYGVEVDVVEKSGNWYSYYDKNLGEEVRLGNGKETARLFLKSHPEVASEIEQNIIAVVHETTIDKLTGEITQNTEEE